MYRTGKSNQLLIFLHLNSKSTVGVKMADTEVENAGEEELLDYDEEVQETAGEGSGEGDQKKDVKGTYVSIHSSGFRDFLLKPELLRAIVDCGFEHPSEGKDI